MQKRPFLILILLASIIGLAMPTGQVAAGGDGAKHIYFTATSVDLCFPVITSPRCQPGTPTFLPNGKLFLNGWVDIVEFTADDPRWTAECIFTGDQFPPGNPNAYPIMGSFVCTPTDPAYNGGWWEGTTSEVLQSAKYIAEWRAKGFGTFDGLLAISRNTLSNHHEVEIIELPGYLK